MNGDCKFYQTIAVICLFTLSWTASTEIGAADVTFFPQKGDRPTILVGKDNGEFEWHMQTSRNRWVSYDINIPEDSVGEQQVYGVFADLDGQILTVNTVDVNDLPGPRQVHTFVFRPGIASATIAPASTPAGTTTLDRTLRGSRVLRLNPSQTKELLFEDPVLAPLNYYMGQAYTTTQAITGTFGDNVSLVDGPWTPDLPEDIPSRNTELPVTVSNGPMNFALDLVGHGDLPFGAAIASENKIDFLGLGDISQAGAIKLEKARIARIAANSSIEPSSLTFAREANGQSLVGFRDGRFLRVVGIDSENGTVMPIDRQPLPPETTTAMAFVHPHSNQLSYMAHLVNQNEIIEGPFGRAPRRRIYLEGDVDRFVAEGDTFEDLFVAGGSAQVKIDRGFLVPEGVSSGIVEARDRATAILAADGPRHAVNHFLVIGNDAVVVREVMEGQSVSGSFQAEGQRTAIATATNKEGGDFDASKFIQEHHSNQLTEHLLGLLKQPNMNARFAGAFLDSDIDPLAEPGELFASLMPVEATNLGHGFFAPNSVEMIVKANAQPESNGEILNTSIALDGDWYSEPISLPFPDHLFAGTKDSYSLVISNGLSGVSPQVDSFHENANRNVGRHGLLMMFEDTKLATETSTEVRFNVNAEQLSQFFDGDFMQFKFVYDGNVRGSELGEMEVEIRHSTPDGPDQTLLSVRGSPQEVAEQLKDEALPIFADGFESGDTAAFYRLRSPNGVPVSFSNDAGILLVPTVEGSFDFDDKLNQADINRLTQAVRSGETNLFFDVDLDGQVSASDRIYWVNELKNTYFGDANLDGEFNTGDLIKVFQSGEYEDGVVGNSNWETGDWDGNGDFETGDLIVAFQFGGYEKGPRANVAFVPEPCVNTFPMLASVCLVMLIRRATMDPARFKTAAEA